MSEPLVAVVGRPNVGKSTLVNRVIGRQETIVEQLPGVTRDCKTVDAEWAGRHFCLVDTGGWSAAGDALALKVSAQAERVIYRADIVLFVADARVGVTHEDEAVAQILYRVQVPVFMVVNKVDHSSHTASTWEFLSLGFGDPYPVSAIHGNGTGDLLDAVVSVLPDYVADQELATSADLNMNSQEVDAHPQEVDACSQDTEAHSQQISRRNTSRRNIAVALVGRANVGKSTLFNMLAGEELTIVHDQPGTTRDSIDTLIDTELGVMRFIDTAGMRRRSRIDSSTEYYSLVRALRSVDTADVALLVIDSSVGVTHQDQRLAERVNVAGCPIVVLLNKWDLLKTQERVQMGNDVEYRLGFLGHAPVLRVSALTGKGVSRLWPLLRSAIAEYQTRIPTREVNNAVNTAQNAQPAPGGARIRYATQVATDPPTFTMFASRPLPKTYLRYIERKLRETLSLETTAIKLRVRVGGSS